MDVPPFCTILPTQLKLLKGCSAAVHFIGITLHYILGDPGADSGDEKNTSFLAPIRSQNGGDRWNWSGKTLSLGALLAVLYFSSFHIYFSARLDFPSPPLSAPGFPRIAALLTSLVFVNVFKIWLTLVGVQESAAGFEPSGNGKIFWMNNKRGWLHYWRHLFS